MVKKYSALNNDTTNPNSSQTINESTSILLSIKTFVLVIGFIFVVVFGFYRLVIEPKITDLDKKFYLMYNQIVVVNNNILSLKSNINNNMDGTMLQEGCVLPDGTILPNNPSSYYVFNTKKEYPKDTTLIKTNINEQTQIHYNYQKTYSFYEEFVHTALVPLQSESRD